MCVCVCSTLDIPKAFHGTCSQAENCIFHHCQRIEMMRRTGVENKNHLEMKLKKTKIEMAITQMMQGFAEKVKWYCNTPYKYRLRNDLSISFGVYCSFLFSVCMYP